jgi:beta-phosphoglucomutase
VEKSEIIIDFTLEHNELLKGVSRALLIILEDKVEASQEDKTNG